MTVAKGNAKGNRDRQSQERDSLIHSVPSGHAYCPYLPWALWLPGSLNYHLVSTPVPEYSSR